MARCLEMIDLHDVRLSKGGIAQLVFLNKPTSKSDHSTQTACLPLNEKSSICVFWGRSFNASPMPVFLITSPFGLALALSAVALSRIGLLLIFVRVLINASASAVEL
jgi:hypothetical protein